MCNGALKKNLKCVFGGWEVLSFSQVKSGWRIIGAILMMRSTEAHTLESGAEMSSFIFYHQKSVAEALMSMFECIWDFFLISPILH